ncbi:MAG TPA: MraY family glycosyltransferase [Solirubrobacterales bacterium]|nr:MraY family glycosyltransferase [Solirubrobacterales bacterium]
MLADGRPDAIDGLFAFLTALSIAWLLVPLTEAAARRLNAIDKPRERSLHEAPTPKLGGLAILCGVLVAGVLFLPWAPLTRAILGGAAVIALVGVLDDVFDLPAGAKLAGQVGAAMIPVFSGVWVSDFTLPFVGAVQLDDVLFRDVPLLGNVKVGHVLTVVGFVAVMNVINFIDGVDGLAAGVCVISAGTFAIIALSLDRPGAGVLAAATAGGSLGFLRHGFPPASSFMGDTGSNLLGYLLATVAVLGALKTNAVVALFFPLIVLAVPILDGGFVVAKRLKYRRPVYSADRWHFHHRMANIGFSQRRTLAYLYGWVAILAGLALALRFVPYSDNHGNFHAGWTVLIVVCSLAALAASVYLVILLEILKLRRFRLRQLVGLRGPAAPAPEEVDAGVARELETGSFAALNPETGEFEAIDPDTGEFEVVEQQ